MITRWKVKKAQSLGWWVANPAWDPRHVRLFFSFADAIAYADEEARAGR